MADDNVQVTKRSRFTTPRGCRVDRELLYDPRTKLISENIELSHPLPLAEVAYSPGLLLERAARSN